LISTAVLGSDLARAMAGHDSALLIGHGVVTTGADIVAASIRAVKLETLCELTLAGHQAKIGGIPALPAADVAEVAEFVDRSQAVATFARWTWDFYVRALGSPANL
jgi:ribulose-5-phosphate 4-epimerase/fuculose-1-phosphate aldolase